MMNVCKQDELRLSLSKPSAALRYLGILGNSYVRPIIRNTRNWWAVYLVYAGAVPSATIAFKDGGSFELSRDNYSEFLTEIESLNTIENCPPKGMRRQGNSISFSAGKGKRVVSDYRTVTAVANEFASEDHTIMDVKGKTVVDIGAFVGDSALYYIIGGGAAKVYAYEPVPSLYELTVSNIRLNSLEKRIAAIRAAASGRNGTVKIDDGFSHKSVTTKAISLDSIVKAHKINNGALKVDCEGCEYDLFSHASSAALKAFDAIHVEYHYGYKDIEERLKREGFKVRHTRPRLSYTNMFRNRMIGGDILATKATK
ncbi:MAG: FkbM family methyltransferase [Candidatus Micrarchaeota archaeon]|nr:FkbM family methyltransferase [Candidatus Micrarchaeota archaeon]